MAAKNLKKLEIFSRRLRVLICLLPIFHGTTVSPRLSPCLIVNSLFLFFFFFSPLTLRSPSGAALHVHVTVRE